MKPSLSEFPVRRHGFPQVPGDRSRRRCKHLGASGMITTCIARGDNRVRPTWIKSAGQILSVHNGARTDHTCFHLSSLSGSPCIVPTPARAHVYLNISFVDSSVETSASNVCLCGKVKGVSNGAGYAWPGHVPYPHSWTVRSQALSLHNWAALLPFSDLVQIQSCQLKLLFALGDLAIDQTLMMFRQHQKSEECKR